MMVNEALEFLPVKGPALTPAVQPFVHDASGLPDEHFKRSVTERLRSDNQDEKRDVVFWKIDAIDHYSFAS